MARVRWVLSLASAAILLGSSLAGCTGTETPNGTGGSAGSAGSAGATAVGGRGGGTGACAGSGGATAAGWLYTSGGRIYVTSSTGGGTPWMGRGVNVDDIYLCGYDNTLWMTSPEQTLQTIISGLLSGWKPNFLRLSLSMDSFPTVSSWLNNPSQYKTPMTSVINAIGTHPGVYVLITLRTDDVDDRTGRRHPAADR